MTLRRSSQSTNTKKAVPGFTIKIDEKRQWFYQEHRVKPFLLQAGFKVVF
jgi:hypothetical protein